VRRSVKIAVEPPGSLRGAMLRAWRTVDDELWGAAEALHEPLAPGLGLASSGPSATDAKAQHESPSIPSLPAPPSPVEECL